MGASSPDTYWILRMFGKNSRSRLLLFEIIFATSPISNVPGSDGIISSPHSAALALELHGQRANPEQLLHKLCVTIHSAALKSKSNPW